jgi:tRNA threonylcarbamoyl adenosine modification protein (Sua5/YciO/YrdC/YwlC family)
MPAFPRTRVARMPGAVVDHLDGLGRKRLLEGGANLAGGGGVRRSLPGWLKRSRMIAFPARKRIISRYFELHPVTPQARLIRQAAEIVRQGGVIAYPTDSCYALGWHIGDKSALERVRRIRRADRHHHFTLVCAELADVGRFAMLDTWQFRMLKACLPGPYTFLLRASRETPRRLQHEKTRTIGVRIPDHPVARMLLRELGEPLMSSTLILGTDAQDETAHLPLTSGHEIHARLSNEIDAVLDGGDCGVVPTTVVDLSVNPPVVVREGRGPLGPVMGYPTGKPVY